MPTPDFPCSRFLVTGLPRSGTNFVLHALAAHPQVLAYNELFNIHKILWGSSAMDEEEDASYLELRDQHPLAFIEHVLTPSLPEITAVGFKLFYMQAGQEAPEKFRLVWPYLQRMEGLKVVDIVRDNRLEQAFSWIKAKRTQVWLEKDNAPRESQQPLCIPFEELQDYFRWFDTMQDFRAKLLRDMDVLTVRYEELAEDFPGHLLRIQQHLGVVPLCLPPVTRKQRTCPLFRSIANYEGLRRQFDETPYQRYFKMAEVEKDEHAAAA